MPLVSSVTGKRQSGRAGCMAARRAILLGGTPLFCRRFTVNWKVLPVFGDSSMTRTCTFGERRVCSAGSSQGEIPFFGRSVHQDTEVQPSSESLAFAAGAKYA